MTQTYTTALTLPLEEAKNGYREKKFLTTRQYIEETLEDWPYQPHELLDEEKADVRLRLHLQQVATATDEEARQLLLLQMLCLSRLRETDNLVNHAYHWVGRRKVWSRLSRAATTGSPVEILGRKLRNRPTQAAITETEEFLGL